MVIIGSTNSGKSNLMKALVEHMPDHERIVMIESRHELMLKRDFPHKNIIEYEVDEEDPFHSSRQAFKLALRQSPKRIIHAEIRDEDANIYIRACTRGHEGSMTSVHAHELEDVPEAITDMCMLDQRGMNSDRLIKRITHYVTQIGLQMELVDGQRKLTRIVEYSYRDDQVAVTDIAVYKDAIEGWEFPGKLSKKTAMKMFRYDKKGYDTLLSYDLVNPCSY
jgi:pilus assembly protein CpaF